MKANLSGMLRSGLAMLLVLCMVVGFVPSAVFANDGEPADKKLYVSLGDSMSNGYGLDEYDGNTGVEDYGDKSYTNKFAEYLGADHVQLAMSAMRVEDLHWLLEVDYDDPAVIEVIDTLQGGWNEELWYSVFTNGDYWTWDELPFVSAWSPKIPITLEYSLNPPMKPVITTYAIMGERSGTVILVNTLSLGVESIFAAS